MAGIGACCPLPGGPAKVPLRSDSRHSARAAATAEVAPKPTLPTRPLDGQLRLLIEGVASAQLLD